MSRSMLKTCRSLKPTSFHQQVARPIAFRAVVQAFIRPYNTSQQLRDYPKEGVFQKNSPRQNPLTRSAQPGAFPQHAQHQGVPGSPPPDNDPPSVFQQPAYEQRPPRSALNKNLWRGVAFIYAAVTVTVTFATFLDLGTELLPLPFEPGSAEDRLALDALTEEFNSLPIVQELRTHRKIDPMTGQVVQTYKEWPAYKAFSDPTSPVASLQRRENTFTTGPLKGSQGLAAQAVFWANDGESLVLLVNFGEAVCGWPGNVHGGAIYTVIDEAMGRLAGRYVPEKTIVTAKLDVDYVAPCKPGEWYGVLVRVVTEDDYARNKDAYFGADGHKQSASERTLFGLLEARAARAARAAQNSAVAGPTTGTPEDTPAAPANSGKVIMSSFMFCVDETGPGLPGGAGSGQDTVMDWHTHAQASGLFVAPKGIELPPVEHRVGSLEY